MPHSTSGADRAGRRSKRVLTPSQKYEIFLQLVRQEVTMMEAADLWQVDRSTIMRIRTVAKQGALDALASARAWQAGGPARPRTGEALGHCLSSEPAAIAGKQGTIPPSLWTSTIVARRRS